MRAPPLSACKSPTVASGCADVLREFAAKHGDPIRKPLVGTSICRYRTGDLNMSVVLGRAYIPAIKDGNKYILMIDGEQVYYYLARISAADKTSGNLKVPTGLYDWTSSAMNLTEINVTSPTCIRGINGAFGTNIGETLMAAIAFKLQAR